MQKVYPKGQPKSHAIYESDGWHVIDTHNIPSAKMACWSLALFVASIVVLVMYVCLH